MTVGELCARLLMSYEWADAQPEWPFTRDERAAYAFLGEKEGRQWLDRRFVARWVA